MRSRLLIILLSTNAVALALVAYLLLRPDSQPPAVPVTAVSASTTQNNYPAQAFAGQRPADTYQEPIANLRDQADRNGRLANQTNSTFAGNTSIPGQNMTAAASNAQGAAPDPQPQPEASEPSDVARLPAALVPPDPSMQLNESQRLAWEQTEDQFAQAMNGSSHDPSNPDPSTGNSSNQDPSSQDPSNQNTSSPDPSHQDPSSQDPSSPAYLHKWQTAQWLSDQLFIMRFGTQAYNAQNIREAALQNSQQ